MSRHGMIAHHLRPRGIRDPRVLAAMERVPREAFVPAALVDRAYDDCPLPIAAGQTISQPYIVALTAQALDLVDGDVVLDVGTGSGYAAAVLAELAGRVYGVELIAELADRARATLARLGYDRVEVRCGDGTLGWPEHAPYQAIAVAAGAPAIPPALLDQLAVGGRLVMPVGGPEQQRLLRVTRLARDRYHLDDLGAVVFVPLIGG